MKRMITIADELLVFRCGVCNRYFISDEYIKKTVAQYPIIVEEVIDTCPRCNMDIRQEYTNAVKRTNAVMNNPQLVKDW